MHYTVVSSPAADAALARIWLQASDRDAVTQASAEIDRALKSAPLTRGLAQNGSYSLTVAPLTVIYEVSPPDYLVTIRGFLYTP
jgi:hypothetical protein